MLIDGQPTEQLPAGDRGLAYGDGLFETLRVEAGRALFEDSHLQRLERGCRVLGLEPDHRQLRRWLAQAVEQAPEQAVVKLILTRGSGGRGYRPPQQARPRCVISTHPLPDYGEATPEQGIRAFVCKQRLARQGPLAGLKHLNRLEQVMASMEFPDAGFMEGLMLDYDNRAIEGTRSNLFLARDGLLHTPSLAHCGVAGVLREKLLELFGERLRVREIGLDELAGAEELFFGNSVFGIWPVTGLLLDETLHRFAVGDFSAEAASWFAGALRGQG